MCLDLVKEMVAGVERSSIMIMMGAFVEEVVDRAGVTGQLNIITEILSQCQEVRDKVEWRLKSARLQEEHIMQMMIAEVARDDRLEERARKRLAWMDRHYRMEADMMTTRMGMLTMLDWKESMEGRDQGCGRGHHHDEQVS